MDQGAVLPPVFDVWTSTVSPFTGTYEGLLYLICAVKIVADGLAAPFSQFFEGMPDISVWAESDWDSF